MDEIEMVSNQVVALKGSQMALLAFANALIEVLPPPSVAKLQQALQQQTERFEVAMLNSPTSELARESFATDIGLLQDRLRRATS